jgi:ribosomal protein L37E
MDKCKRCGKSTIEFGKIVVGVSGGPSMLHDTADVLYNPLENKKIFGTVFAKTCRSCGNMEFYVDPNQLDAAEKGEDKGFERFLNLFKFK